MPDDMTVIRTMQERVSTLHLGIAHALCPGEEAGSMRCREPECNYSFDITPRDVAHYLRHGWPRHCNREMRWIRTATDG